MADSKTAEWGLYIDENSEPGTGSKLGESVIKYIFINTAIESIIGEVMKFNTKSICLHLKPGFTIDSVFTKKSMY